MSAPILYDWSGKPVSAANAPVTGRPAQALTSPQGGIVALGSDYAATPAAQIGRIDALGNQYVVSSAPNGSSCVVGQGAAPAAAYYGGPVMVRQDAPSPATWQSLTCDPSQALQVHLKSKATARYILPTTAGGAAGKSMFSLVNGSASTAVRIQQVNIQTPYIYTTGGTLLGLSSPTNTSVVMLHEMRRITGHTKAASTVVVGYGLADTTDTIDPAIVAYSNATLSGASTTPFHRADANSPSGLPWYLRGDSNQKTLLLRPGEGMSINTVSTTSSYNFDIEVIVTVATA